MFFSVVLSYLPYALVTSFTPGPNNILAFHTVGQKGWVQGRATLAGIVAGFFSVMAVCALGCYQLERLLPALTQVLPFAGALYLFWLALHLLRSTPAKDVSPRSTFWSGFFLQFVNGKIILYAITIYTGYVLPAGSGALFPIQPFVLTLFGTAGFLTWAVAGGLLHPGSSFLNRSLPIQSPMAFGQTEPQQPGRPLVRRRQAPYSRLPVPGKARAVCLTEPGSATESGHRAHWRKSHRPAPGQPR